METNVDLKDVWVNLKRVHIRAPVPYGYKTCDEDEKIFIPDPTYLPIMEKALDYIDAGRSYREVANWLNDQFEGWTLSHQGMKNIWLRVRGNNPDNKRAIEQKRAIRKKTPKTPKGKAELDAKRRVAGAKRSLTFAEKRLDTFADPKPEEEPVIGGLLEVPLEQIEAVSEKDTREIIFEPNPGPQTEFLAASEKEVLYGGAAGGGKSYALLADPLRYFANPNFNGIIFRRTNDELRELKFKAQELYKKAYPGTVWKEKDSTFIFPSGARLWFTYLERDDDVLRYQGQAFTYVAFDELTQYPTPFSWTYMESRLRDASGTLPLFMRATTNPGGPGHGWVKRTFIDPAPHGQAFDARDIETGEVMLWPTNEKTIASGRAGKPLFKRRFIPAKLSDNKYLYEDGQYEAGLLSMSENQRRQLLDGDWNVADGAAFPEFREKSHVIEPFKIPPEWRKFRSCDYGYRSFSAVHWYAIDPAYDTLIVYRELYVTKLTGAALSKAILELENGENIQYGILDSSVWHQRGHAGPTIAEEMITAGTRWRPSDRTAGARINSKNRLHELLKINPDTDTPGIVFFNTCRQIIADLPIIPSDPNGTDDIDKRYTSDHAYDSIRYGIMTRPRASTPFDFSETDTHSYRPASLTFGY